MQIISQMSFLVIAGESLKMFYLKPNIIDSKIRILDCHEFINKNESANKNSHNDKKDSNKILRISQMLRVALML